MYINLFMSISKSNESKITAASNQLNEYDIHFYSLSLSHIYSKYIFITPQELNEGAYSLGTSNGPFLGRPAFLRCGLLAGGFCAESLTSSGSFLQALVACFFRDFLILLVGLVTEDQAFLFATSSVLPIF